MVKKLSIFIYIIIAAKCTFLIGMKPDELAQKNFQLLDAARGTEFEYLTPHELTIFSENPHHSRAKFQFYSPDEVKKHLDIFQVKELLDSCSEKLLSRINALNRLKKNPELEIAPLTRLFLVGPPGSGKSSIPLAIAYKIKRPWARISAAELSNEYKSGYISIINGLFAPFIDTQQPGVIGLDEISGFTKRQLSKELDPGAVEHLLTTLDRCKPNKNLLVVFTDNTLDNISKAMQSRLSAVVFTMELPHTPARQRLLHHYLSPCCSFDEKFWEKVAKATRGFDLREMNALVEDAKNEAFDRIPDADVAPIPIITQSDVEGALQHLLISHNNQIKKENYEQYKEMLKIAGPYLIQIGGMAFDIYLKTKFQRQQMAMAEIHHGNSMAKQDEYHADTMEHQRMTHWHSMEHSVEAAQRQQEFTQDAHAEGKTVAEDHHKDSMVLADNHQKENMKKQFIWETVRVVSSCVTGFLAPIGLEGFKRYMGWK